MNDSKVIIKQFEIGAMGNFGYFIGDPQTHRVAVVDPAWDENEILKMAKAASLKLSAILLTHGHPDHVNAVEDLIRVCDIPIYISAIEAKVFGLNFPRMNLTKDGDEIRIGNLVVRCLHTPGHTPGSVCYQAGNILLTGDTLFVDGCGRCDLEGGDPGKMYHTLYDIILKLPEDTVIYPGHDYGGVPCSTLGEQKQTNPYLTCQSKAEFLQHRMGVSG